MAGEKKRLTVRQEMKELGIEERNFYHILFYLKNTNKLLSDKIVPEKQYDAIADYLRNYKVIDKDNNLLKEGFKLLENRLNLEIMLESFPDETQPERSGGGVLPCRTRRYDYPKSSGGVLPCRKERDNYPKSSGGFAPCRNNSD